MVPDPQNHRTDIPGEVKLTELGVAMLGDYDPQSPLEKLLGQGRTLSTPRGMNGNGVQSLMNGMAPQSNSDSLPATNSNGLHHAANGSAVPVNGNSIYPPEKTTHLNGPTLPDVAALPQDYSELEQGSKENTGLPATETSPRKGLLSGLWTLQWMREPASSAKILAVPLLLWLTWPLLIPDQPNPFSRLITISYPLPPSTPEEGPHYGKGYNDFAYLAYYVVVLSLIRQLLVQYLLIPLAKRLGIRKQERLDRFAEQGYAVLYFSVFGTMGVIVMSDTPAWWFRTEHLWLGYPHYRMTPLGKTYHLLQSAYWIQQLLVLVFRLEKPRKDNNQLLVHHFVTLWLVWWSYLMNFTRIGNAVFVTMDISDMFLALAKCFNYLKMERTSTIAFAWFVCVWTYLRHYLNAIILWSIYKQWVLMGPHSHRWAPKEGIWATWWLRDHMFFWVGVIQLLNIYWYFLIWRILLRALFGPGLVDERSDDEDESAEPAKPKMRRTTTRSGIKED